MRKFQHSGQFQDHVAHLKDEYESIYRKEIERIIALASKNPMGQPAPIIDECLENHARTYIINGMFEALNWPLQSSVGLPKFVPEAPIESLQRGTRRFLDYFGLSSSTRKPLIIVEAKRPSLKLPSNDNPSEIFSNGLKGISLGKDWDDILSTIRDYVCSTTAQFGHTPHRVVITNGNWLLLFLNPVQTFVSKNIDVGDIIVYSDADEICDKAHEVWEYLEYNNIAGKTDTRSYQIGELPFTIDASKVKKIALGLKLIYYEAPTHTSARPQICILPIVLISSHDNVWVYVQRSNYPGFELPHRNEQLGDHFREVSAYSASLLSEVVQSIQLNIDLSPVLVHYEQEEDLFNEFKGVNAISSKENHGGQHFILLTGVTAHFISENPSVADCRYHIWKNSQEEGVAIDTPVFMPSVFQPKSSFVDGQPYHCSHISVQAAKMGQLSDENKHRCGLRSNPIGSAFCEIIQFEELLCCRVCVFESVCTKSDLFRLPCQR